MKKWIKLETDIMNDPRIQKLIASNLRQEGFGIYITLRLTLECQLEQRMHINCIHTIHDRNIGFRKLNHVIKDFDLFYIDGNGTVTLRPRAGASAGPSAGLRAGSRADTCHDAPEPFNIREREGDIYKEIKKEIFENGNHDFDERWT